MKEKYHVGLPKTWWVLLCITVPVLKLKKGRRLGEVWGSATGVGTWCPSHPCAATCAAPSWSYELAAQASTEEWCLLPPAALEKQKGHFYQGGMKGGPQTGDSLGGVAGCLVHIKFLTVPRGKESLVSHLFPVLLSRGIEGRGKLHGAHGPASCAWVLPYHGHVEQKGATWSSQKAVQTEAPSVLTQTRCAPNWSICSSVCLIMPQNSCKKLQCW